MASKSTAPTALTTGAADVLTTPASGLVNYITRVHVANIGTADATFSAFLGLTGASLDSTALYKTVTVKAGTVYNDYGDTAFKNGTYFSALASANNALVMTVDYDQEVLA